jgi:hypothetical protein
MLTPKFELTQTETKVCVIVFAPYTNISETEIYVEKNDFRFFSPPYYLRYVEYIENIHYFMSVMFCILLICPLCGQCGI